MDFYRVLHSEWSQGWGGQEIRILEECLGMVRRGHQVALVGPPGGRLAARAREAGLAFHDLPMHGPWDLPAVLRLARLLRRLDVQILHTHSSVDSWVGGFAARMSGRALVRTRHLSLRIARNPLNFVYRMPQAMITTGQGISRHLVQDHGLAAGRVHTIPTGVDTQRFAPGPPDPELAAELAISPDAPVVAMVAVLRSWKRHDIFCQMARQILERRPDARFLIVGDGPGRERIAGYIKDLELGPAVIMTGHREDVSRILRLCTVCVLTSDAAEGVPQAVLQELACARAVAASDAGDISQVIHPDQTGLLVPPGQVEPLVQAVERLLDQPELRRRLGEEGRRLVEARHSTQAMLEATEQVYAQVAALRAGRPAP